MCFPFSGSVFNPYPSDLSVIIQIIKRIFIHLSIAVIIGSARIGAAFIFQLVKILLGCIRAHAWENIKCSGGKHVFDAIFLSVGQKLFGNGGITGLSVYQDAVGSVHLFVTGTSVPIVHLGNVPVYQKPLFWAGVVGVVFVILNLIFW